MNIFNVLEMDDHVRLLENVFSFNEATCSIDSMCLILYVCQNNLL
jgi:hypothetical protein